jgi:hypothetical protein
VRKIGTIKFSHHEPRRFISSAGHHLKLTRIKFGACEVAAMTKMSVSPSYEKGLSRQADIDALKAGKKREAERRSLPKVVTEAVTLVFVALVGGACAWVATMWLQ